MFRSPKYDVICELGRGGNGLVYKVRHVTLETILAVKVLNPDLADDPDFAARFEREARVMARLTHRNIVRVFDIDMHEGVRFIVMEHVEGTNLEQLLKKRGRLPLAEALAIAEQVAQALVYAHAHAGGVIHRDIKPSNIIIETGSGRAVVTDFGIAKLAGTQSDKTTSGFLGTLRYCAPEYVRGEVIDGRVDIYGLGLVLYEMLVGVAVFGKLTGRQILARLIAPEETPLRFFEDCPGDVRALITRAAARDRERRFPTAAACLAELERVRRRHTAAAQVVGTASPAGELRGSGTDGSVSARIDPAGGPDFELPLEHDDAWVLGTSAERTPHLDDPAALGRAPSPSAGEGERRARGGYRRILVAAGVLLPLATLATLWAARNPAANTPPPAPRVAVPATPPPAPHVAAPAARPPDATGASISGAPSAVSLNQDASGPAAAPPAPVEAARQEASPGDAVEAKAAPAEVGAEKVARAEAPTLGPPRIQNALPASHRLDLEPGDAVEFRAEARDSDGSSLPLAWIVDGRGMGRRPSFRYQAPAGPRPGSHTVVAEAVGESGQRERVSWQIAVAAAPQAPRLLRVTPAHDTVSLAAGGSRLFTVDAELPGADDPLAGLSYEWQLDGVQQVGKGDRFELRDVAPGDHRLAAVVRGPTGAQVMQQWNVKVAAIPDAPLPVVAAPGAADVEIVELSDTPTRDKRSLMVEGKLRNRGGGAIERLVVLVQGLDEAGNVVVEEDGVPAPQPLAPGELAFFRLRMANDGAIRSFRVVAFPR